MEKVTLPIYAASTFIQATATGAAFVAFPSTKCDSLQVENNTGTDFEIQKNGAGPAIKIPTGGGGRYFSGISNANQLAVRRVDQVATNLVVTAEAITV